MLIIIIFLLKTKNLAYIYYDIIFIKIHQFVLKLKYVNIIYFLFTNHI